MYGQDGICETLEEGPLILLEWSAMFLIGFLLCKLFMDSTEPSRKCVDCNQKGITSISSHPIQNCFDCNVKLSI